MKKLRVYRSYVLLKKKLHTPSALQDATVIIYKVSHLGARVRLNALFPSG